MRRAEWRRRADDPTGLFGWWWRGVGENRRLVLAILPFGVCAAVGFAGGGWGWLVLATANLAFVAPRSSKVAQRLIPLLPDPSPKGQFLASVAYRREETTTGTDEMALVVVDGWLYAEGVRSQFAVRREHLRDLRTGSDQRGRLMLSDGSEICLRGIDDAARIALERWWQTKAFGDGAPTFPPARVHPQELARRAAQTMSVPFVYLIMPLARPLSPGWDVYIISLLALIALFVMLMVLTGRRFLELVQIDDKAKEVEKRAQADAHTSLVERPSAIPLEAGVSPRGRSEERGGGLWP